MQTEIRLLDALIGADRLARDRRPAVIAALAAPPSRAAWAAFLHAAGLAIGTGLILTGIVYLVAFNWQDLGYLSKLSVVLGGLGAAAVGAIAAGPRTAIGQLLCASAAILAGGGVVLYTQAWQTGADPWELFAAWSLLALPFALASRTPALWAVQIALFDATIGTWLPFRPVQVPDPWTVLTALGCAHVVWGFAWPGRWLQAVLWMAGATVLTVQASMFLVLQGEAEHGRVALQLVLVGGLVTQVLLPLRVCGRAAATLGWLALSTLLVVEVGVRLFALEGASEPVKVLTLGSLIAAITMLGFVWLLAAPRLRSSSKGAS